MKEPDFASNAIRSGTRWVLRFGLPTHQFASLGDVRGWIAFANGTIAAPGRPPQPIHATTLSVDVWCDPTVRVRAGRQLQAQIKAGERPTHSIVDENACEVAVPLSPDLATDRRGTCCGNCPVTLEHSLLEIDAPSEIALGETETVNVTVTPPDDAERGRDDAELNRGIRDPARDKRDTHWQEIDLNVQV